MAAAATMPLPPGVSVAQAPGTLVLVGDPAEWTDGSAIVLPTGRLVTVQATHGARLEVVRAADDEAWFDGEDGPYAWIGVLARALARTWGLPHTGRLRVDGDLRQGQGMRAATAVAVVRALAGLHGRALGPEQEIAVIREACPFRALAVTGAAHGTALHVRTARGAIHATPIAARLHLVHGRFPRAEAPRAARETLRAMFAGELRLRDVAAVRRVGALNSAVEDHERATRHALHALRAGSADGVGAALEEAARADVVRAREALDGLRCPGAAQALRALAARGALGARMFGPGGDVGVAAVFRDAEQAGAGVDALDALGLRAESLALDVGQ